MTNQDEISIEIQFQLEAFQDGTIGIEDANEGITELFDDYVDYINYKNLLTFSNNKPKSFSQFTNENL